MTTKLPETQTIVAKLHDFPVDQVEIIVEEAEQIIGDHRFNEAMKNPAYRKYVEDALAEGVADIKAGRVYTLDEIKQRHGVS